MRNARRRNGFTLVSFGQSHVLSVGAGIWYMSTETALYQCREKVLDFVLVRIYGMI